MNILWLSHFVPFPPKGGAPQRSYNLLAELARHYAVHLYAFNEFPVAPGSAELQDARKALSCICKSVTICDPPFDRAGLAYKAALARNLLSRLPYSADVLRSEEMGRALQKFTAVEAVDVVHVDAVELSPYALGLQARLRVLNHHNAESVLLARRARRLSNPVARAYMHLQAKKLARYEARVLPRFDINLAVSGEDRNALLQLAPSARIEVIPNGVDTRYFHPTECAADENALVYVGGLTWFPNRDAVNHLVGDIWPLIREELSGASCKLVGRIPPGESRMHLPAGIEAVGFVDDVRPYLASAAALIVPLRVGGGTRLKILDALACGKAVVSTSIGCEGLGLVPEKEILVADTPREFAKQTARVCRDAALRNALGRAGRARVERDYSWTIIGEKYRRLLEP